MKIIAVMLLALGLPTWQSVQGSKPNIVLPNPKLLTCKFSDCSQLWLDKVAAANATFPKQLIIDSNQRCIYGMTALYEKSISLEELEAAIDQQYGKWAVPGFEKSSIRLWRVEPEKFAIQLSVADKKDEKRQFAEAGTKLAIFITFGGQAGCNAP